MASTQIFDAWTPMPEDEGADEQHRIGEHDDEHCLRDGGHRGAGHDPAPHAHPPCRDRGDHGGEEEAEAAREDRRGEHRQARRRRRRGR